MGPLLNAHGCRFFSLQKVPAAGDWDVLANLGPITDLGPELGSFSETAAVIEALDLVITVDTATAHLAGGLGKLSWLMLPFIPDWRWMLDTDESPWYPCLRLFSAEGIDSWPTVIERMTAALHDDLAPRGQVHGFVDGLHKPSHVICGQCRRTDHSP